VTIAARVRPATPSDEDTIVAFNASLARESEHRNLDLNVLREGVRALLTDVQLGQYLIAEADGKAVGQLMWTSEWSDWRNGRFWWIQSVYVAQDWRGRGVFKALYDQIDTLSRTTPGVCGLRLYVERANARAQAAYRGCGLALTDYLVMETDRSGAVTGASGHE